MYGSLSSSVLFTPFKCEKQDESHTESHESHESHENLPELVISSLRSSPNTYVTAYSMAKQLEMDLRVCDALLKDMESKKLLTSSTGGEQIPSIWTGVKSFHTVYYSLPNLQLAENSV